ncbi:hypothetical protein ACOI1H_13575 [Loktanella sp. DJP18]|uniref:hypothetical protein n=1 Tax=Loktanella sp. DJP18 TaxID=3409788 RepID=UPI003BB812A3
MHRKFPSIEQFPKIYARETYSTQRRAIAYRPKIKLHGTNMAVRIHPSGHVALQCKTFDLTVEQDYEGFAGFMQPFADAWAHAASHDVVTFYGEWAGPGIAKGCAIQRTGKRRFYIFAAGIGETIGEGTLRPGFMVVDPEMIRLMIPKGVLGDDIRVLDWEGPEITLDFADEVALKVALDDINARVDAVAICDPFVARTFGVKYPGEGYVYVPTASVFGHVPLEEYSRLTFKAKTAQHRVQKMAKAAPLHQPLPATAAAFVVDFCTQPRLEQALQEVCGGIADKRKIGALIQWMNADIAKEAADEITALASAGVPFDRLKGLIATASREWFSTQVDIA